VAPGGSGDRWRGGLARAGGCRGLRPRVGGRGQEVAWSVGSGPGMLRFATPSWMPRARGGAMGRFGPTDATDHDPELGAAAWDPELDAAGNRWRDRPIRADGCRGLRPRVGCRGQEVACSVASGPWTLPFATPSWMLRARGYVGPVDAAACDPELDAAGNRWRDGLARADGCRRSRPRVGCRRQELACSVASKVRLPQITTLSWMPRATGGAMGWLGPTVAADHDPELDAAGKRWRGGWLWAWGCRGLRPGVGSRRQRVAWSVGSGRRMPRIMTPSWMPRATRVAIGGVGPGDAAVCDPELDAAPDAAGPPAALSRREWAARRGRGFRPPRPRRGCRG